MFTVELANFRFFLFRVYGSHQYTTPLQSILVRLHEIFSSIIIVIRNYNNRGGWNVHIFKTFLALQVHRTVLREYCNISHWFKFSNSNSMIRLPNSITSIHVDWLRSILILSTSLSELDQVILVPLSEWWYVRKKCEWDITARFKMLGHFQIFVSAPVFGVNIRFWYLWRPSRQCLCILHRRATGYFDYQ